MPCSRVERIMLHSVYAVQPSKKMIEKLNFGIIRRSKHNKTQQNICHSIQPNRSGCCQLPGVTLWPVFSHSSSRWFLNWPGVTLRSVLSRWSDLEFHSCQFSLTGPTWSFTPVRSLSTCFRFCGLSPIQRHRLLPSHSALI
jgi:hypothetical protein